MNPLIKTLQESDELFDKEFGAEGPEKNCDSIGAGAGCDDCHASIIIRGKHKSFNHSRSLKLLESLREEVSKQRTSKFCICGRDISDGRNNGCSGQCARYYNSALSGMSSLLDEAINLYRK